MTRPIPTALLATLLAGPACAQVEQGPPNVPENEPAFENQTRAPAVATERPLSVGRVATGLEHPWGIAVLPDGSYLVTERPGRLRRITRDGGVSDPIEGVPAVAARGQGGLLDVALGESFAEDRTIYLTYAKPMGGGDTATAAARAMLSEDFSRLADVTDIFVQDPPADNAQHFGSRVVPDGDRIFITTGEHFTPTYRRYAQDLDKTYGKVIRVTPEGGVPEDNPFADRPGAKGEILVTRPPQPAGGGDPARDRRALDVGTRAGGRRRAEPYRGRRELRLARGQLRRKLPGHAGGNGRAPSGRLRRAALLLGSGDRSGRLHLL